MYTNFLFTTTAIIEQTSIVWVLVACSVFFFILLFLGIKQSRKLKAENEKLMKASEELLKEEKESYTDFTEGHMYQKKND